MHHRRLIERQRFHLGKILAGAPLHHVGGERPGTACKTNERHAALKLLSNQGDGIHDITQLAGRPLRVERVDLGGRRKRALKPRALTLRKVKTQTQGIGHREDIREEDGGIHGIAPKRLQGDLAGQLRVSA